MKKLLLMKTMLLLCALIVGSSSVWAADVTFTNTDFSGASATKGGVTLTISSGSVANDIRIYKNATLTVSANVNITCIQFTCQASNPANGFANMDGFTTNGNNGTWTGSSTEVVFTASNKQVRCDQIVVTINSGKTDAGLAYSVDKYKTTFGAAFSTPVLTNPHNLAINYTSSDPTVAAVDALSGAITIYNKIGSTTITASSEETTDYSAGEATYKIFVFEHDGSAENKAFTVAEAKTYISNEFYDAEAQYYLKGIVSSVGSYISSNSAITYYISDNGGSSNTMTVYQGKGLNGADFTDKADMQELDQVTLLGKFNLYNTSPQIKESIQVSFKRKAAAGLVAIADFDMYRDTEKDAETLFTINSTGEVSYESSDETIAKIESGKLKALKVGTATITISVAANDDFNAGSDAVKVTVKNRDAVAPEGANVGGYTKITSAAELTDGDYLIVCESHNVAFDGYLSTLDATENLIDIQVSNNTIAESNEVNNAIFTYDATNKTLKSKSEYYIGQTANANGLASSTSTTYANTITFDEGNANIVSGGAYLRYNKASNQLRFRYYKSSSYTAQEAVQLYKKSAATSYDITIGATGYKTLISAISATLPDGLTAYKAVSAGEGKIQLTSVASIKAGCAYVLKGTASTDYTLTVTDTPEEPTGNILEVSDENTSNGVYVLANGTSGPGFYKWMGGSLGAGRAIVPASAVSSSAREYLEFSFDNDVTAIEAVKTQNVENDQFFNLAGQRVAQPTKGLYIVNGKKVVIK